MPFWTRQHEDHTETDLRMIVGLGNPGAQFANTRHNVGFMVTEHVAERHGLAFKGSRQRADVARGTIQGVPILLAHPLTFMNESGNAVSRLLQYYHVPVVNLLVICDDIDLPFGALRVRPAGGHGGNGGLRSIITMLGTDAFARLRVGVGRPHHEAVSHVLGKFPPDEARLLPGLLQVAARAVECFIAEGTESAMNAFNRNWLPELEA